MVWNSYQIRMLIDERRARNEEYWTIAGNSRVSFWENIASKINLQFQASFTGAQCKEKFQNLIREHMVREIYRLILFFRNISYNLL